MSVDIELGTSTPQIVEVKLSGKLEAEDFERFGPAVERLMEGPGALRLLVRLEDFHGWTPDGLWEDIKFDAEHFDDVERVAIVGDKMWHKGMAVFCKPFTTAEVRYYEPDDIDQARQWLRSAKSRNSDS